MGSVQASRRGRALRSPHAERHLHGHLVTIWDSLGAIPGIGGAAQELLDHLVGSPLRKRQEEWFASLAEGFAELAASVDGLSPDALAKDEVFISTVARTTQLAMATHGEAKREALRNVVLNTAAGVRLDETLTGAFLSYVERFSEGHLQVLALMDDPMADVAHATAAKKVYMGSIHTVVVEAHPDLARPEGVLDRVWEDLEREKLLNGSFKAMMSAGGVQSPQTTTYGKAFLEFIHKPRA